MMSVISDSCGRQNFKNAAEISNLYECNKDSCVIVMLHDKKGFFFAGVIKVTNQLTQRYQKGDSVSSV